MKKLLQTFTFLLISALPLSPLYAIDTPSVKEASAQVEKHAKALGEKIGDIWNFKITTIDKQPITVAKVVIALILLIIGFRFAKRFSRWIGKKILPKFGVEPSVAVSFQTLTHYFLLFLITILVLYIVNVPLTLFTLLGGALAIGIGFGSQNIVANFISGLILIFERPIKVGDLVQVDETSGVVEKIGARSTRIRTFQNTHLIVPNSFFLEKQVLNWTLSDDLIRTNIKVGVAYGSPTRDVEKILKSTVALHSKVLKDPEPIVLFNDFGESALDFEVNFWIKIKNAMDRKIIESDLRYKIDEAFKNANITIAFPQRDVHLTSDKPLKISISEKP